MNKMFKNILIAVAIIGVAATAFMCSGSKSSEEATDSTVVVTDTVEVSGGGVDSTAAVK
jgi:deoxyinosine 3'endonuclease (endonuclease V)